MAPPGRQPGFTPDADRGTSAVTSTPSPGSGSSSNGSGRLREVTGFIDVAPAP